jgi:hypothetical protein
MADILRPNYKTGPVSCQEINLHFWQNAEIQTFPKALGRPGNFRPPKNRKLLLFGLRQLFGQSGLKQSDKIHTVIMIRIIGSRRKRQKQGLKYHPSSSAGQPF